MSAAARIGAPGDWAAAQADPVHFPSHYTQHPTECIEIAEQLSYPLGNAVKYCWRHADKANPAQDLRKAAWYLRREAARLKRAGVLHRIACWWRLRRLYNAHSNEIPNLVAIVLEDALAGEFEVCAMYLGGLAALHEGV